MPRIPATVTHNNKTYTLEEAAKSLGISLYGFRYRMEHYPPSKWFEPTLRSQTTFTVNGETHTISEWAKITNIKHSTLFARIKRKLSPEQVIIPPPRRKKYSQAKKLTPAQQHYRNVALRFRNTKVETWGSL